MTRSNILRHVTYNLLDYGRSRDDGDRLRRVRETIDATDGDVFSIQEIYGETDNQRYAVFAELASSLGLEYNATLLGGLVPTEPVFDPGRGVRGVGVMWRPDRIESIPGSLRVYDRAGLHVGMALVRLRIEDRVEITVASTHWPPRYPRKRADEAVYVAAEITKQGDGIVGADWNNVFASIDSTDPDEDYYDPDPYEGVPWDPRNIGKALPVRSGGGRARREAMKELLNGGLFDPAAYTRADCYSTVGHWREDAIPKRIDGPMTTEPIAKATRSIRSFAEPSAMDASDHLPVLLDVDLDMLQATPRPERAE